MIVGVVGGGALGTLYAASLAREADVRLLVRNESTARAFVERGGRHVEGEPANVFMVTHDPAAFRDVDLALIAVKAFTTVAALEPLRNVLPAATPLASLQNGLDADVRIDFALDARPALAYAPTTEAALSLGAGFVRHAGRGMTTLGWAHGRASGFDLEALASLLRRCALDAVVVAPIEPHVWAKAIVNAAINPLTALARVSNGALLERPELAVRLAAIAREGAAVALAAGVTLPFRDPVAHVVGVARATAGNRSSMLHDLETGRPTEIEEIDGAIVRIAARLGVPVPEIVRVRDEVRARTKA